MPDFDELRLHVSLADEASAGLAQLRTKLTQLGDTSNLGRFQNSTREMTQLMRPLATGSINMRSAMNLMGGSFATAGVAVAGLGFAIANQSGRLQQFADDLSTINRTAQTLGVSGSRFTNITNQLVHDMGFTKTEAQNFTTTLTSNLQDLLRTGSDTERQLMALTRDRSGMRSFIGQVTGFIDQGDLEGAINHIVEGGRTAYENELERLRKTGSTDLVAQMGARDLERKYYEAFGLDATVVQKFSQSLRPITEAARVAYDQMTDRAGAFTLSYNKLGVEWRRLTGDLRGASFPALTLAANLATDALRGVNDILDELKAIDEWMTQWGTPDQWGRDFRHALDETVGDVRQRWDEFKNWFSSIVFDNQLVTAAQDAIRWVGDIETRFQNFGSWLTSFRFDIGWPQLPAWFTWLVDKIGAGWSNLFQGNLGTAPTMEGFGVTRGGRGGGAYGQSVGVTRGGREFGGGFQVGVTTGGRAGPPAGTFQQFMSHAEQVSTQRRVAAVESGADTRGGVQRAMDWLRAGRGGRAGGAEPMGVTTGGRGGGAYGQEIGVTRGGRALGEGHQFPIGVSTYGREGAPAGMFQSLLSRHEQGAMERRSTAIESGADTRGGFERIKDWLGRGGRTGSSDVGVTTGGRAFGDYPFAEAEGTGVTVGGREQGEYPWPERGVTVGGRAGPEQNMLQSFLAGHEQIAETRRMEAEAAGVDTRGGVQRTWDWLRGRKRQFGGPVSAGQSYLVGEAGPEMFVPGGAGAAVLHQRQHTIALEDETTQVRSLTEHFRELNDYIQQEKMRQAGGGAGGGGGVGGEAGVLTGGMFAGGGGSAGGGGASGGWDAPHGNTAGPGTGVGAGETPARGGGGGGAPNDGAYARAASAKPGGKAPGTNLFKERAPRIMDRLQREFGLTREQAAGLVGNLGYESAGFKSLQEKQPLGGKGGYGYAQWTGPRRREFEAWSRKQGLDPSSEAANEGFLVHELRTSHRSFTERLKKTGTLAEASKLTHEVYERPADVQPKYWGKFKPYASAGGRYRYSEQALALHKAREQTQVADARKEIDTAGAPAAGGGAGGVETSGKLTVNVTAPKGTQVAASGDGAFSNVEVNRNMSMEDDVAA